VFAYRLFFALPFTSLPMDPFQKLTHILRLVAITFFTSYALDDLDVSHDPMVED
jgi:hypothetical protein